MFLWIRLNSELLRYQGVQNFAKNNTENAELASKMLKQQHFLYQRKNLYNQEPSRSSSGENVPEKHLRKFCRGMRLLEQADVIIYAGSLVNPELLSYAGSGAKIYDSAKMTLEEVLAVSREAEEKGLTTVRLHTGERLCCVR